MKTFTFQYDPHPLKSAFASIERSMKTGHVDIQKDSITCKSTEDMMTLMTKSRMKVFSATLEKSPESLTELADSIEKDLGNTLKDAKVLESIGLIELKRLPGKQGEKLKPIALYQRIVFECEPRKVKKVG
ncbi:MAG: hypothetical protein KA715_13015 [Xanthomonadaceae bacterium]|nr:hypothetical protein [Xanthomonadaceae bacterium]